MQDLDHQTHALQGDDALPIHVDHSVGGGHRQPDGQCSSERCRGVVARPTVSQSLDASGLTVGARGQAFLTDRGSAFWAWI